MLLVVEMVRAPFIDKNGLRKGAWSKEEDEKLRNYIAKFGHWNWRELPKFAGLSRCGKSCRLRWLNYLQPNVKHGNYSKQEEELIIRLHNQLGNKWSEIAARLPGRTDNEIKNHWHVRLKKLSEQGKNSSSYCKSKLMKACNGQTRKASQTKTNYEEEDDEIRKKNDITPTTDHSGNSRSHHDHVPILESSLISSSTTKTRSTSSLNISSSSITTTTNNDQLSNYLSSAESPSSVPFNPTACSGGTDSGTNMINDDFWTQPFHIMKDYTYDYGISSNLYHSAASSYSYLLYDDSILDHFYY